MLIVRHLTFGVVLDRIESVLKRLAISYELIPCSSIDCYSYSLCVVLISAHFTVLLLMSSILSVVDSSCVIFISLKVTNFNGDISFESTYLYEGRGKFVGNYFLILYETFERC